MLRDDLKEVQRKREYIYKILSQYRYKMGMCELMTLNDYFNMIHLLGEIEILNKEGGRIVRQITETVV